MLAYRNWLVTTEGHVATVTLNRPEAKNSLTLEALAELRAMTAQLRVDPEVWVVVVQGQGDHFCTGVDLSSIRWLANQPEPIYRQHMLEMQLALDEFEALEKPAIAKVRGFCISGGLLLALCCDLRVASERSVFSLPEVKLGLAGVTMGTQRILRVAGEAAARELILLGERFDAHDAQRCGFVQRVVAPDQLDATVSDLAAKLLKLAPRSLGIAKRLINLGHSVSLRASQDLEIDAQAELLESPDFHESLSGFIEKRPPRLIGR